MGGAIPTTVNGGFIPYSCSILLGLGAVLYCSGIHLVRHGRGALLYYSEVLYFVLFRALVPPGQGALLCTVYEP